MQALRSLSPVLSVALVVAYSAIGMATAGAGLAAASPLLIAAIGLPVMLDRRAGSATA